MEYKILVCDDEPDIRAAMRRTLHRFDVTAVESVDEALAELRHRRYHAVVSDFQLGVAADGLGLLQLVRLIYPDTVRVLITGSPDVQVAIRALNEGAVHRYFRKPWDDDQLVSTMLLLLHTHVAGPGALAVTP